MQITGLFSGVTSYAKIVVHRFFAEECTFHEFMQKVIERKTPVSIKIKFEPINPINLSDGLAVVSGFSYLRLEILGDKNTRGAFTEIKIGYYSPYEPGSTSSVLKKEDEEKARYRNFLKKLNIEVL